MEIVYILMLSILGQTIAAPSIKTTPIPVRANTLDADLSRDEATGDPQQKSATMKTEHLLNQLHGYEIVVPELVDHHGDFVSYDVTNSLPNSSKETRGRSKRSTDEEWDQRSQSAMAHNKWIFYRLKAYGTDFHFNLTLNQGLVSPNYVAEYWTTNGVKRQHYLTKDCHYVGHISSHHISRVALSNCYGLHGIFATDKEEYFVEPLWNDTNSVENEGHFHIVYKRSAIKARHKENDCGVTDKEKKNIFKKHPGIYNDILKMHPGIHTSNSWRTRRHKKYKRRRHKRSVSTQRHVETLLVVDKRMVKYHGKHEIEPYVLTVMNIVAQLFQDDSIGNEINIVVTRLILLTEDQPHLKISHHADRSLESFCKWQQMINPPENSDREEDQGVTHHDNAVLLTRYDICTHKNQPCGTLGLAPVAGMCEPDRSCSINEDIGLASAFTIAHELGHNFGMQHDGAGNICGTPGYEPARIMASQLTKNTEPFSWSSCSRNYITGFLDSGRGKCLENTPTDFSFEAPSELPGVTHSANEQCKYQYGSTSRQCKVGEVCRELWCTNPSNVCVTNSIPAAEGTICTTKKDKKGWCYRGDCKELKWKPKSRDGNWGEWSSWGQCSRTCGGGVVSSERNCDNPKPSNGGKYCIGERKRYKSCNIHDCPINSTDFREVQCSKFDDISFRGTYYQWKPFSGVGQVKPCALNCLAVGFNFYTERASKVIDGTRCYPDSLDMCINGECRHVGCDRILGSEATEDKCRVCGGKGDTCDTMKGIFLERLEDKVDSYHDIIRIPQGAVHIKVKEKTISRNYLALKSHDNKYYINGAWTIDWPRKFEVAGTVFHYQRPEGGLESLSALGPTSEDVIVLLLVQEGNEGIEYEYNMPTSNSTVNGTEHIWQYSPWSECSVSCSKGISKSSAICVRKDNRNVVNNKHCKPHLKPSDRIKYCNNFPCPARWDIGDWSECTKTCGGGYKTRIVKCLRGIGGDKTEELDKEECPSKLPKSRISCNKDTCPSVWAFDGWSGCQPVCGTGIQRRNVYCVSAAGTYTHEHNCNQDKKPPSRRKCNNEACPKPDWVTSSWGECSSKCGQGQMYRNVACRTYLGEPSDECRKENKPNSHQQCEGPCIPQKGDINCVDVKQVQYCPLVVKFKFCQRAYFRQMCCKTCADAGL